MARLLAPGLWLGSAIKFVFAFTVLLIPTFLMGGTLPVLTRAFAGAGLEQFRRQLALFYGVNTLGGVAGCALAGYVLIESVGLKGTLLGIGVLNLLLGGAALLLARGGTAVEAADAGGSRRPRRRRGSRRTSARGASRWRSSPSPRSRRCSTRSRGRACWCWSSAARRTPSRPSSRRSWRASDSAASAPSDAGGPRGSCFSGPRSCRRRSRCWPRCSSRSSGACRSTSWPRCRSAS